MNLGIGVPKFNMLELLVPEVGYFSIDEYMNIYFDTKEPYFEFYWAAHGSKLNERGYDELWESWQKFCNENDFAPDLSKVGFRKICLALFRMYETLKM